MLKVIVQQQRHNNTHRFGGFMQTRILWVAALVAMLYSMLSIPTAIAGGTTPAQPPVDVFVMAGYTDQQGFVVEIPAIDPQLLTEQLKDLRAALLLRRAELVTVIEDLEMGDVETILSVLLPGGLIYAGYRKHEYEAARHDLAEVDAEINELASDLSNFESVLGDVAVRTVE
jgi:hypothetical protein